MQQAKAQQRRWQEDEFEHLRVICLPNGMRSADLLILDKGSIGRKADAGDQHANPHESPQPVQGEQAIFRSILGLSIVFLIIAMIAGLFGFGVVSGESWEVAKVFFFIFLVLAVLSFVGGFFARRQNA
jgi:uncharacterized membrane protein YtjA (UPF0391 family)